jgi:hypothetical protein
LGSRVPWHGEKALANVWTKFYLFYLSWKELINPAITFFVGAAGTKIYGSWKRIRYTTSDWKLWYMFIGTRGGVSYRETPPGDSVKYHFTARFFNEKPFPIGLHRFSIQFTKGKSFKRQVVMRDDNPRHGELQIRAAAEYFEPLGEMVLPPRDWAVENVTGYSQDVSVIQKADAVWFMAYTADGKIRKWHVADLKPIS